MVMVINHQDLKQSTEGEIMHASPFIVLIITVTTFGNCLWFLDVSKAQQVVEIFRFNDFPENDDQDFCSVFIFYNHSCDSKGKTGE